MKIFVAGATGALGRRLVPLLVANGHTVVGTTRTPSKVAALRAVGATPVVLDALDRDAVIDALTRAEPEVVVHELTALAGFTDFRKLDEGFAATNRLRTEGTDHLLEAIRRLAGKDVSVRLVTGDNRLAARKLAAAVGLDADRLLTGIDIDRLDDQQLARRADGTAVFAEVEPLHKERIVRALRAAGQVVGFLGDGINDAAALAAADVGISVDTAVDVAKQSAAIVLLDKSLAVVADGVRLGRQTFANTLKYIRVTTSANFGNVLSMAAAAGFLPFLPLLPRQILLLNFLSDIPGTTIAADTVDPEQVQRPRAWDLRSIRTFMNTFGLLSSVFDVLNFLALRLGFGVGVTLFRSGWFIESTVTELAVMLVLRTNRPFYRSRPGRALLGSSAAIAAVTIALPYSPLAGLLGLVAVPARILAALAGLTALYVLANEAAKRRFPPDLAAGDPPR